MDNLFFYASKIIWLMLKPDSLLVLLMLVAAAMLYWGKLKSARRLVSFLALLLLIIAVFPIGNWMIYPLESRFPSNPALPEKIDGILILGGSVLPQQSDAWGQLETNQYAERLMQGVQLARRFPDAKVVFTGGSASIVSGNPTEAAMVRDYFIDSGINQDRLILERKARNTAENALFSKQLVQPHATENWILVTTAYHMPRSMGLFCEQGWRLIPYPVDHATVPDKLFDLTFDLEGNGATLMTVSREWVGLLAYYLAGKISSPLPSDCRG